MFKYVFLCVFVCFRFILMCVCLPSSDEVPTPPPMSSQWLISTTVSAGGLPPPRPPARGAAAPQTPRPAENRFSHFYGVVRRTRGYDL